MVLFIIEIFGVLDVLISRGGVWGATKDNPKNVINQPTNERGCSRLV